MKAKRFILLKQSKIKKRQIMFAFLGAILFGAYLFDLV
ncbi:hypothetical protein bthur0011_16540 [Bacillus thuringiensis serovar huazhongensis BGSC 4BD1]|nr:hypothetical protein bthur0011_16540 [Bacillus thuringiensis serovar huazhongensis BGSC 4BD1]